MASHFLLSAAARTLSLKAVFKMGEDAAYDTFRKLRWPDTDGEAVCPKCGCPDTYNITTRKRFKCVQCGSQFSVTSGTIFASRKLSYTDLLAAIVLFVNGAKGVSALQVSRDLDVQYKTAFVLSHKLREAMSVEMQNRQLNGVVEIDGAYFGGYVKPANEKADRKDLRLAQHRTGKRQSVIVARERGGKSVAFTALSEAASVPTIRSIVANDATVFADEATGWDALHGTHDMGRVNHSQRFYDKGVCTNQAESYFSRLRRMEVGTHHNIAGPYLNAYAGEASWREDNRRVDNGQQTALVATAALNARQSRRFGGYWQRAA